VHGTDTSTGVGPSAQAVPDDLAWSVRHTLATAGVNPSDDPLKSSNFDEMRDQIIVVARLWSSGQGSKN